MFWTNVLIDVLLFFFVITCLLMCLVVLMQRSKQEGLGAAFGSGMMSDTFGAQTSAVLVKATVWLAALFFIFSICLARLYSNRASEMGKGSVVQQELLKSVAPATNAAPVAVAPAAATPTNVAPATVAPTTTSATTNALVPAAPAKPADK